eukprot:scaffold32346_cov26-Cyclotella_meneghiniana.AAC.1
MKGPPPLPETSDPYELLGFSYHNPPKDADDIRRAYVKRAKKYHPDAIHPESNDAEREMAARNFKRINDAYRKLKDEKFRLQDEFFATTMGGAMYEPRGSSRHIRRPFSYGRGFDDTESAFSGSYSARHGAKFGETKRFWEKRKAYDDYQRREQRSASGRGRKNPFGGRHEVRDNCHVDVDFPPLNSSRGNTGSRLLIYIGWGLVSTADNSGWLPIHYACSGSYAETAKYGENGSDVLNLCVKVSKKSLMVLLSCLVN